MPLLYWAITIPQRWTHTPPCVHSVSKHVAITAWQLLMYEHIAPFAWKWILGAEDRTKMYIFQVIYIKEKSLGQARIWERSSSRAPFRQPLSENPISQTGFAIMAPVLQKRVTLNTEDLASTTSLWLYTLPIWAITGTKQYNPVLYFNSGNNSSSGTDTFEQQLVRDTLKCTEKRCRRGWWLEMGPKRR